MEKSVGRSRQFTGKVNRPRKDKLVESVVEQIPSWSTEEHVQQELRTGKTKSGAQSKRHEWLDNPPSVVGFDLMHNKIHKFICILYSLRVINNSNVVKFNRGRHQSTASKSTYLKLNE